mgnify:CR=1 FL=1
MADDRNNLPGSVNPGQIREGAGREESRINEEFVELLKKYSTPALLILLIVGACYVGLNYYRGVQARALDAAFSELDQALRAGSPDGLVAVAQAHEGQRAVATIARLNAADIHLAAARTGLAVGVTAADLNPDGSPRNEDDLLTDEQRKDQLEQAARLYQRVIDDSAAQGVGVNITAINAMFGLASVAEMRGDVDAAATWYTRIADRAAAAGLTRLERIAKERKESLAAVASAPVLYSLSQLAAPPPAVADPGFGAPIVTGSDGTPIQLERVEFPPGPVNPGVGDPGEVPDQPVMPRQPGELDDGIPLAPGSPTPSNPEPTPGG